jgi:hypothetical protein
MAVVTVAEAWAAASQALMRPPCGAAQTATPGVEALQRPLQHAVDLQRQRVVLQLRCQLRSEVLPRSAQTTPGERVADIRARASLALLPLLSCCWMRVASRWSSDSWWRHLWPDAAAAAPMLLLVVARPSSMRAMLARLRLARQEQVLQSSRTCCESSASAAASALADLLRIVDCIRASLGFGKGLEQQASHSIGAVRIARTGTWQEPRDAQVCCERSGSIRQYAAAMGAWNSL